MTRLARLAFVALPVLWVALAHIGPLVAMLRISLLDAFPAPPGAIRQAGLGAYAAFAAETGGHAALAQSLMLAALVTLLSFALAWPLAWHVAVRVRHRDRMWRLALLVAPFWTSEVLRMFALVLLLSRRGALNTALHWLGLTRAPLPLLYGTGSVLAGLLYTVLLTMLLPLHAALLRLPRNLLDAASGLGADGWRGQLFVALPLVRDGLTSGVALTFMLALGVLAAPTILGGAGTPGFASVIAAFFDGASGRWPLGAAFSVVLLVTGTSCAAVLALGTRAGIARILGPKRRAT